MSRRHDQRVAAIDALVQCWREDPAQMLADLSKDEQIDALGALTHVVYGADSNADVRALKAQDLIDCFAAKRVDQIADDAAPELEQAA